jgi:hypothetical protein
VGKVQLGEVREARAVEHEMVRQGGRAALFLSETTHHDMRNRDNETGNGKREAYVRAVRAEEQPRVFFKKTFLFCIFKPKQQET